MRILLDENLPRQLKREFSDHTIMTVQERGWSSMKNGELLRLAATEFDVFMTSDQNLSFQQNLIHVNLSVIVLVTRDIRLEALKVLLPEVHSILPNLQPGAVVYVPSAPDE